MMGWWRRWLGLLLRCCASGSPGFHKEILEVGHHTGVTFSQSGRDLVAKNEEILVGLLGVRIGSLVCARTRLKYRAVVPAAIL